MKYIRQLDSLRGIAVLLVIIWHWFSRSSILNWLPNGVIGVNIFFVLSGFLITGILLENRSNAETSPQNKGFVLKNFYFRRILRIFPIYYLLIFLLLIFEKNTGTNIKSAFLYFVTYTSNFYFFGRQDWDGMLSHLWSLSVEEQFYLIWPWVILFLKKEHLIYAIALFIMAGIISQYIFFNNKMGFVLTTSCFDAFGLGALLAWWVKYKPGGLNNFFRTLSWWAALSLICGLPALINYQWRFVPDGTVISVLALWVITYVVYKHDTKGFRFKWIFNNKLLIFFGKISYGIYLYHLVVPVLTTKIAGMFNSEKLIEVFNAPWHQMYLGLVINFIILIFISWLSWNWIEKPFLNFKKYFDYKNQQAMKDLVFQNN